MAQVVWGELLETDARPEHLHAGLDGADAECAAQPPAPAATDQERLISGGAGAVVLEVGQGCAKCGGREQVGLRQVNLLAIEGQRADGEIHRPDSEGGQLPDAQAVVEQQADQQRVAPALRRIIGLLLERPRVGEREPDGVRLLRAAAGGGALRVEVAPCLCP